MTIWPTPLLADLWQIANRNDKARPGLCLMAASLPILVENALQIAWDFLDGVGEIADPQQTAEFLLRSIQMQMLKGEARILMLSNRAIESYRQRQNPFHLVSCC